MKKANTISYELENQYALYAYYSQLNPWMLQYAPFATPAPLPQESFMHDENINEQMKMSSETASSEREASPLQKTEKSSEEFGKFVLMESQEEEQKYSVELNTVSWKSCFSAWFYTSHTQIIHNGFLDPLISIFLCNISEARVFILFLLEKLLSQQKSR